MKKIHKTVDLGKMVLLKNVWIFSFFAPGITDFNWGRGFLKIGTFETRFSDMKIAFLRKFESVPGHFWKFEDQEIIIEQTSFPSAPQFS